MPSRGGRADGGEREGKKYKLYGSDCRILIINKTNFLKKEAEVQCGQVTPLGHTSVGAVPEF